MTISGLINIIVLVNKNMLATLLPICCQNIIYLGNFIFKYIPIEINNQNLTSFIAIFLIVSILMIFYEFKFLNSNSISSIFIGIWLIFSGLGANMYPNSFEDILIIVFIIILYSLVGLIAGVLSMLLYIFTKNNYCE